MAYRLQKASNQQSVFNIHALYKSICVVDRCSHHVLYVKLEPKRKIVFLSRPYQIINRIITHIHADKSSKLANNANHETGYHSNTNHSLSIVAHTRIIKQQQPPTVSVSVFYDDNLHRARLCHLPPVSAAHYHYPLVADQGALHQELRQ